MQWQLTQKDIYTHKKEPYNAFNDNKVKKAIQRKCLLLYVDVNRGTKGSALKPLSKL